MSKGGTVKAQLEAVTEELVEEEKLWKEARLPHPMQMFRMGNSEFQHHCHVEALTRIVREVLLVSEDQMNLIFKSIVLQEMRALRQAAGEVRKEALRQDILRGVNPFPPTEI